MDFVHSAAEPIFTGFRHTRRETAPANLLLSRNTTNLSMKRSEQPACVLSIAGSDSGSAAGIQADLKTFAAHDVHGLTAITAITAQNTRAITAVRVFSPQIVLAQLDAVWADFRIEAVKIGMLGSAANIRAVAGWLQTHRLRHIVVDPVLAASSGNRLLPRTALASLRRELLPLAEILTPNVPEAESLLGRDIRTPADMRTAARELRELGAHAVLLKGGHLDAKQVRDVLVDDEGIVEFVHRRRDYAARGTGCSLASAIAARLARGSSLRDAVRGAERYLQIAFRDARPIGKGASRILRHETPRLHD